MKDNSFALSWKMWDVLLRAGPRIFEALGESLPLHCRTAVPTQAALPVVGLQLAAVPPSCAESSTCWTGISVVQLFQGLLDLQQGQVPPIQVHWNSILGCHLPCAIPSSLPDLVIEQGLKCLSVRCSSAHREEFGAPTDQIWSCDATGKLAWHPSILHRLTPLAIGPASHGIAFLTKYLFSVWSRYVYDMYVHVLGALNGEM